MTLVHPTAQVPPAFDTTIPVGPYSIIEEGATIGEGTEVDSHVRIERWARLGRQCRVFHGAVIGSEPQDLKFHGEASAVTIGDHTILREYVTVNRGTEASGKTVIGDHCLLMSYVHVAHDCRIGDHAILSNAVNMAGHVNIGDFAVIGGLVPIHQFVRIGSYAMIGGGYRVHQDVPPFVLAAGEPIKFCGLNYVGLRRNGFSEERIRAIDRAYYILYRSKLRPDDALEKMTADFPENADVRTIVEFVRESKRGWIRI